MENDGQQQENQTPPPPSLGSGKGRGRPVGSKNKPKQQQKETEVIIRETPNSLTCHFLEIPPDNDLVQALTDFTLERHRGICILSATGSVKSVSLSSHYPPGVLNFTGRFEILSLSGAFLPPPVPPAASGMSVFLSGEDGRVVGGKVAGPLVTAEVVVVGVSAFAVAAYERLPLVEDDEEEMKKKMKKAAR